MIGLKKGRVTQVLLITLRLGSIHYIIGLKKGRVTQVLLISLRLSWHTVHDRVKERKSDSGPPYNPEIKLAYST